jgi:hypothetical protein
LLKFKLGHYPPSVVVSLIHPAAAHRSGRQARVQNAVADADRHAAAFGGRINPSMYKACATLEMWPRGRVIATPLAGSPLVEKALWRQGKLANLSTRLCFY